MAFDDPIWDGPSRKVVRLRNQGSLPGFEPARETLPLTYFDDIKPCTDALDFVEGLMVEGSAGVVYGESNSGKTFFVLDLALHIAAGMTWRGREVEQGGVIYVAMEGGVAFRNRVTAWKNEIAEDRRVSFAAIMMPINMLDEDADTDRLIEAIGEAAAAMEIPVRLVVIDTLSRAMAGGNENSSDIMGALVMNMDRIRDATKAAVWFVHHSGKDAAKGARGHSLLRAAIDTEIEITAPTDGAPRAATVVKQREMPKGDTFPFSLRVVDLGRNRRGKPVTSCIVEIAEEEDAPAPTVRLKGHARRAMDVLHDAITEAGKSGYPGVPDGFLSVPEDWWRQRFYDRTTSDGNDGVTQNGKRMAFNRAAQDLVNRRLVGIEKGRVWPSRPAHLPAQNAAQNDD